MGYGVDHHMSLHFDSDLTLILDQSTTDLKIFSFLVPLRTIGFKLIRDLVSRTCEFWGIGLHWALSTIIWKISSPIHRSMR